MDLTMYGYAEGGYWHAACDTCGKEFVANKRAYHCRECAEELAARDDFLVLKWETETQYFISFTCPRCGKQIDQGHLEDQGIVNGDTCTEVIECPNYECGYKITVSIRGGRKV